MKANTKLSIAFLILGLYFIPLAASASTIDGTIGSTNRYAWSENAGWIDFGSSQGNVHVSDSGLTGYGWSELLGWISLSCANTSSCSTVNYGISNTSQGVLSGYAYSENAGWIQFNPTGGGVTIDSSGNFSGYAWGENVGWIVFNCSTTSSCGSVSYLVSTDWRPLSTRASSVVLVSSMNPSTYGTSITLTATVTPSTASGFITFQGAPTLGTVLVGHGSGSIAATLQPGSQMITATYGGIHANYLPSTSNMIVELVNGAVSGSTSGGGGGGRGGGGKKTASSSGKSMSSSMSSMRPGFFSSASSRRRKRHSSLRSISAGK